MAHQREFDESELEFWFAEELNDTTDFGLDGSEPESEPEDFFGMVEGYEEVLEVHESDGLIEAELVDETHHTEEETVQDQLASIEPIDSSSEGIITEIKKKRAFEREATEASNSNHIDKKTGEDLVEEHDRKEAAKQERKENRKEALKQAGTGLIELAKVTGKGVKETARIAYNLAAGAAK